MNEKHKVPVLLYSAAWSVQGLKYRSLLQEQMISFMEFHVDKSPEARVEWKSLGCRKLPGIVINGQVIEGFHPLKIKQLTDNI